MGSNYRYFGSLTREELEEFEQKHPGQDYKTWIKAVIKASIKGTLTPQEAKNIDMEIKKLKKKKLEKEIVYIDIKIAKEAIHDLHISPSNAIALRNGEVTIQFLTADNGTSFNNESKPIPSDKTESQKTYQQTAQTMPLSIWDESENQFICPECNPLCKFNYRYGIVEEMINVVSEFQSHVMNTHGRKTNEVENKVITEYLDWVNKHFVEKNK